MTACWMFFSVPASHAANVAAVKPSAVIDAEQFGYGRPGELYLTLRYYSASLDFIDAGHLLFTFSKKGLLRHTPDEQPDDDDQVIHAVVVDLASGKETASGEWRMHDRQRYLWPLGKGTFLVRQRDSLYLTGPSLEWQPYGHFPGRLVSLQVAVGGKLMVAQTENSPPSSPPASLSAEIAATPTKGILIRILRIADRAVVAKSSASQPVMVPVGRDGILEALEGQHGHWILSFEPLAGEAGAAAQPTRSVADLTSACAPALRFLSAETILAVRCTPSNSRLATAISLDGKMLWEQKWQPAQISGALASSEDGSRFAQSTLLAKNAPVESSQVAPSEITGQRIAVFETATGKLLLTASATPVYDVGGNFALSADGRHLAILHNGTIEIYDIP